MDLPINAAIECADEPCGHAMAIMLNPVGDQVTHLVVREPGLHGITHVILREGHLWKRQDVTIPVAQIDHIDDDSVYLKLNKHQIEAPPALAVQRRSR